MKPQVFILLIAVTVRSLPAFGQAKTVGGPCEGCEAIYESPVPFDKLDMFVKLPDANWAGQKPIGINGIVYKADGKTPAPGVVLYIYHTDQTGHYTPKADARGWGRRHGQLRGWMRTDEKGAYKFVTLRPAPYPGRTDPAHIHITVKEPGINEYYIDEYLFADDPLLTSGKRQKLENRGGSGILTLKDVGNMFKAERHIYLGKNIPNYPREQ
ncbi:intradiol ring-cleavage dioxygenase [Spirosoma taeanense]|uniref:Intradiol ring-cleavage dioxygenase n=1 Tax=Spirosoma taeanense TaxID=2735870 RepID=A0A6M5Y7J1_9BACT|nr:intradiol ring-cleavage dioxygenase [Spirosoma taeanense]QJW89454.1 intradiol ring-cleavage dioxygenase [Spirosoma taeanense]